MRRLFMVFTAVIVLSGAAMPAAGASGAHASASPHKNLGSDQIVTVTWTGFKKLGAVKHQIGMIECLGNYVNPEISCDGTGLHETADLPGTSKGSAQIDIASGPLYNEEGRLIGHCGTTAANNNCMIVVGEDGAPPLQGEWHIVDIPISFKLPS